MHGPAEKCYATDCFLSPGARDIGAGVLVEGHVEVKKEQARVQRSRGHARTSIICPSAVSFPFLAAGRVKLDRSRWLCCGMALIF